MLLPRILTAVVALVIIIPAIALSLPLVRVLVWLVSVWAFFEYIQMTVKPKTLLKRGLMILATFFSAWVVIEPDLPLMLPLGCFSLGIFLLFLFLEDRIENVPAYPIIAAMGLVYPILFFIHLLWIREMSQGALWIFWTMAGVFVGDSMAYFVGKSFGKHKMIPRLSPGKTWEGYLGQWLGAGLGCSIAYLGMMKPYCDYQDLIAMTIITGLLAPFGDLFESMLKRGAGVKDSGRLMPGHGGILDRVDALIFCAPVVFYYMNFIR